MSEEKKGPETQIEGAGPETVPEEGTPVAVEEEETVVVEEEDVDEKGVSFKNRLAEQQRKHDADLEQERTFAKREKDFLLKKLEESTEKKETKGEDQLHTDEEINTCETMAQAARMMADNNRIERKQERERIAAESEAQSAPQRRFQRDLAYSYTVAQEVAEGEDFGDVMKNGRVINTSPISKRMIEIYDRDRKAYSKLPVTTAMVKVAKLALKELRAEVDDPDKKKNTVRTVNSNLGGSRKRVNASSPIQKDGEYYRALSTEEYLAIESKEERTKYLNKSVDTANFTK